MRVLLGRVGKIVIVGMIAVCLQSATQTVSAQEGWGTLKGRVTVTGDLPEIPIENVGEHADKALCLVDGKLPKDDNLLISEDGGLSDVFVMMYVKGKGADAPIHESYDSTDEDEDQKLAIDNVNCRFVPHAIFARTGSDVLLKNSDSVGHNCLIATFNNEHNVNLPAGSEVAIALANNDKVPGQFSCSMHGWMDGVILVRDNPYVAITDADGNFEIKNVPAGEWEFQFWHKKAGFMKKMESDNFKFGRKGESEVMIAADGELDMGTLEFPAKEFK